MERLDKLVASAFGISRTQAQFAIRKGRVSAGGEICRGPEKRFAEDAALTLDGQAASYEKYVYVMMDKPEGYLSATEDSRDLTVADLLPEELRRRRLGVVGRLDKDATGLVLLTDDGELNHRLTSPRYHMDKVYWVVLDGPVGQPDVEAFAQGVQLSDFKAMPALLQPDPQQPCQCRVVIGEGKFHQVKRMFEKRGRTVLALRRLSIGGLQLDDALGVGGFRKLTESERKYLLEKCGIKQ